MTQLHITATVLLLLLAPKPLFSQVEYNPRSADKVAMIPTGRIVGGKICHVEEHPYMVSIRPVKSMAHICGGTILSPTTVLTAAHCVVDFEYEPNSLEVVAGLTDEITNIQIRVVEKVYIPASYSPVTVKSDLSVIHLNSSFEFNHVVQPVRIAPWRSQDVVRFCPEGQIIGWGESSPIKPRSVKSDELRCARVPVISHAECQRYWNLLMDKSKFCTLGGGVDGCLGDSGGPLMCGGVQVGVISAGNGCASPNHPAIYARVDYHFNFIMRAMNGQSTHFCSFSISSLLTLCIISIRLLIN